MTTLAPALRVHVDDPDVVGSLAVFPLIADAEPSVAYVSFAAAAARGATVTELATGASVNDLLVTNPLDVAVLLYAGQEVLGAQQNRIIDDSVLVAARSEARVSVSCVEHGRWDGARCAEPLRVAPQAAYPSLRAMKHADAHTSRGGRSDQGAVWTEVAAKASRYGVSSATSAINDVYEHHRHDLDRITISVVARERQVGAVAAVGSRFVVLDHVSSPETWAVLHSAIVQGYALDALETDARLASPSTQDACAFMTSLLRSPGATVPTSGLGELTRSQRATALTYDGELIALTAFA